MDNTMEDDKFPFGLPGLQVDVYQGVDQERPSPAMCLVEVYKGEGVEEGPSLLKVLLKNYQGMKEPSPGFTWLFDSAEKIMIPEKTMFLLQAIKRQVTWNAIHDGVHAPHFHSDGLSPYHEALTIMWTDCPGFENVGMFQLFIDEFIDGIKLHKTPAQNRQALLAFIASQITLENHSIPEATFNPFRERDREREANLINPDMPAIEFASVRDRIIVAKNLRKTFNVFRASYFRGLSEYYIADMDQVGDAAYRHKAKSTHSLHIRKAARDMLDVVERMEVKPDDSTIAELTEICNMIYNPAQ